MSRRQVTDWLRAHIEGRTAVAAVRFGEGEARLLAADPDDIESMKIAIRKLRWETGLAFSPAAMFEVRALLAFAFDEAEVLGISFGRDFHAEHQAWMRSLAARYRERLAAGRRQGELAHCLFSYHILDTLPELLAGRPVSVISCRDVKPVLEADWALEDVAVYQTPSQHVMREVDGAYEAALHDVPIWPDFHATLRSKLTVREPGEVFLVGSGIFGKDLCIRIRDRGGIAIDMGSAFDRMSGKVTRGEGRPAQRPDRSPPQLVLSTQERQDRADGAGSDRLSAVHLDADGIATDDGVHLQ